MNIDKRTLREVAEKATPGPWKVFSDIDTKTFSIHTPRDKRCENVIKWGGFDCQPNAEANAEFIAAFNPKVALALLDELEHYKSREERVTKLVLDNSTSWDALYKKLEAAEHRIAEQSAIVAAAEKLVRCKGRYHSELNYRALAKLFGVITPDLPPLEHENVHYADAAEVEITALRQRIAELERSETQLINERDAAESALADMYQAATGERPEWSNMFGFADAVDVVKERLATLDANQSQTTPTGIQLITEAIGAHGYIVGCMLQGRPDLALEESRKWVSAFGQAAEIVSAQDADDIKVKGE
ncbi:ead/Ea22-like family protein [Salmonella enterica subsp. enterica serovar Typhimurium]|uniref:Ead/Ea22-like family protein n=1 Tax=Salmonella typhimurium TaxID=90371 RepID=A0A5W5WTG9_SALTM|nr:MULTISPECIES: ead/Ea22-like family protein [Salmonella]EAO0713297.1 ead/Ea22-like family protein [Salmonella enterica]EBR9135022.1 ead/Ea22-like family protein [Salmonella enterica subsp. enterica serovar Haifa]ECI4280119.1 ead/Ea22-like family protein [Salmonella enterica subsp. enterica]EDT8859804.1 ead/Ea22-like family protein [Salmonella enterica subsp. enterica serovar Agbeni]EAA3987873.1 ead/Ea22-like family protein [Salmonella enterica subsp. enterica serovar Typhimurium]